MKKHIILLLTILTLGLAGCSQTTISIDTSQTVKTSATSTNINIATTEPSVYTLEQVSQHDSPTDCWLIIENNVYDVSDFTDIHPGGSVITTGCGKDVTADFNSEREHAHGKAQVLLKKYYIGEYEHG